MPGTRLHIPPDDIADWHSVVIEHRHHIVGAGQLHPADGRAYHISVWLEDEIAGPYYVKRGATHNWHMRRTIYCFRDLEDQMMFAFRFA